MNSTDPKNADTARAVILYALLKRAGGHVMIRPEEMPGEEGLSFTIMRRVTPEGGLEVALHEGGLQ